MELGAIHPGWIILYALFNALMGSRHKQRGGIGNGNGNGSILHEFPITLLMIAVIGGALLFLTMPISGALWKPHPVQHFGGIWAIAVGLPLTIVLSALVFLGGAWDADRRLNRY